MSRQVSTNSICPFPFTFENNDDFKGEERFDIENEGQCTQTLGEFYGDFWDVLHFGFLILYFVIFLPMFLLRVYKLKKFATKNRKKLKDTAQYKVYSFATLMVFFQAFACIDLHGTGLYILDFLIKSSAKKFKKNGLNKKIMNFLLVFFFIFYIGIGSFAIFSIELFNVIISIRKGIEFLITTAAFFLSRHYKDKLIKKLNFMQYTNTGNIRISHRINKSFKLYDIALRIIAFVNILLCLISFSRVAGDKPGLIYDPNDPLTIISIVLERIIFAVVPISVLLVFKPPTQSHTGTGFATASTKNMILTTPLSQRRKFSTTTLRNYGARSHISSEHVVHYPQKSNGSPKAFTGYGNSSDLSLGNRKSLAMEVLQPSDDWNKRSSFKGIPELSPKSTQIREWDS
eukprot:snap_masked-scaffold_3-processed-gene-21.64-mRNA-1 protein AED:1.00 eAED:1.00 QI:0/0/0/0/1/1/2/0/400